jgi:putative ABC transport system permease protein
MFRVSVTDKIASVREVDWRAFPIFRGFPTGCLPRRLTRDDFAGRFTCKSRCLQREVVQKFPNVSAIDLTLILQTVEAILNKLSFVIRFMALFTVMTGLLVLTGAILTGRFQRIRESILLRTLGASRAQILRILVIEYLCLGVLSALTGMVLAVTASWVLAVWVFHVHFKFFALPLLAGLAVICTITILIGLLASRGILNHPPLAVLRAEA